LSSLEIVHGNVKKKNLFGMSGNCFLEGALNKKLNSLKNTSLQKSCLSSTPCITTGKAVNTNGNTNKIFMLENYNDI
jgi:hypothetical protein